MNVDIDVVQARDPKGLYAKVKAGEITSFTGMSEDAPYEMPLHPDIDLPNNEMTIDGGAAARAPVAAAARRRRALPMGDSSRPGAPGGGAARAAAATRLWRRARRSWGCAGYRFRCAGAERA
ncbi:adenylylsulfate kinase [Aureococcus anophagefferens]|uniref:Adenylylsulfate kinase n=1 Tax=Aureococcus anophagefferens TaxID=44056 RepID=A0ABR1G0W4_AURAN